MKVWKKKNHWALKTLQRLASFVHRASEGYMALFVPDSADKENSNKMCSEEAACSKVRLSLITNIVLGPNVKSFVFLFTVDETSTETIQEYGIKRDF